MREMDDEEKQPKKSKTDSMPDGELSMQEHS
jgi:hypothetical protein